MDQYFTYEARLASFQKTSKKRGSTAGGRGKALNWPHKQIAPASLAKAGFYFDPYLENPDNCACFLCGKGMDGWEAGDDPLEEHLKHASACGWAISVAIELDIEAYAKQDPNLPLMVEARKATFAGKWPHEGKKGWKCKTKQLVEAGWNYTPTEESDDMATCAYCQLALDGWEPSDKPYDEHYNRSPNCSFFTLIKEYGTTNKKTTRGKATRTSRTLRHSVQSAATASSDIGSIADITADPEDSILTTTSILSQAGKKMARRTKKTTTATTKAATKNKPMKSQAMEEDGFEDHESVHDELPSQLTPLKYASGKKRTSEAMEDSVVFLSEAPAPKKQATAPRDSTQIDSSTITPEDDEMVKATKAIKSAADSGSKSFRKPSVSVTSLRATTGDFPDDEEIERQLEAELDRFTSDDEIARDSELETSLAKSKPSNTNPSATTSPDYAMLDLAKKEADEEDLDEELRKLEAEMKVDEPKQELHVPKKGRKAGMGTGKASIQTKVTKAKAPSLSPQSSPDRKALQDDKDEVSFGSTDTVIKKALLPRPITRKPCGVSAESSSAEAPTKKGRGRPPKIAAAWSLQKKKILDPTKEEFRDFEAEIHEDVGEIESATTARPKPSLSPVLRESSPVGSRSNLLVQPPSTPARIMSPAPSARQPALSPSQSPQSSDAENQPPSSLPAARTKRVVLAPITATPVPNSPSKRKILAARLQSQTPWTAVDLDAVISTPSVMTDKENAISRLLKQGNDLSSPEKQMTVEEWFYFNASEAEKKLKHECEAMVTQFEREGTRAMNVLEGLVTE